MGQTGADQGGSGPIVGLPRWVKISGIAAAVLAVLLVVVLLFGGGRHGPGRHFGGLPASTAELTAA